MEQTLKHYLEYMMLVNNGRGQAEMANHYAKTIQFWENKLKNSDKKERRECKSEIKKNTSLKDECEGKMKKIDKRIKQLQKKYITIEL